MDYAFNFVRDALVFADIVSTRVFGTVGSNDELVVGVAATSACSWARRVVRRVPRASTAGGAPRARTRRAVAATESFMLMILLLAMVVVALLDSIWSKSDHTLQWTLCR